jgi:Fic/DOC family protein
MAVDTARFAHCQPRHPVAYRPRSPFRPAIFAPLDFAVRVTELYTLDHELDRIVLRPGSYSAALAEQAASAPGGGGRYEEAGFGERPVPASVRPRGPSRTRNPAQEGPVHLGEESARFRPPWTVALVQEVHASLFRGVGSASPPGVLRIEPLGVGGVDGTPLFLACPPERVARDLEEVLAWIDEYGATYHPVVPATVLFEALFAIRPFPAGNAELARTMATMYLHSNGLRNVELAPVGRALMESPHLLQRLLIWTEASGSYSELLDYTLDSILLAYARADVRWLLNDDPTSRLEETALRLLARARRESGWFSARDARRWVGAGSEQTVLRYLNLLVERQMLETLGQTRGKRFRLATPVLVPSVEPAESDPSGPDDSRRSPRGRRLRVVAAGEPGAGEPEE